MELFLSSGARALPCLIDGHVWATARYWPEGRTSHLNAWFGLGLDGFYISENDWIGGIIWTTS